MSAPLSDRELAGRIDLIWGRAGALTPDDSERSTVSEALARLDSGACRVAEKIDGKWIVHQWLKKVILLSFRLTEMRRIPGAPGSHGCWWDKPAPKFENWNAEQFQRSGIRAVPGSFVRYSAYIAPEVVLMPSFVNLGARVDSGTMIDSWATVGSCAQIGRNVHISGGVGIGGVLEPLQAAPVIIEDDCFIGARSEIAEGVIVEEGSVLSMGVYIGASTRIIDRDSGEIFMGRVPAGSVVVPGSLAGRARDDGKPSPSLYCAVIVKKVDARTRAKTALNEILRDGMA